MARWVLAVVMDRIMSDDVIIGSDDGVCGSGLSGGSGWNRCGGCWKWLWSDCGQSGVGIVLNE